MKGQTTIFGAILFFVAAIIFVVFVSSEGFRPETKIGTKQYTALTLKEQGVSALITVDQAIFYSSYKAIIDSADNGLVYDKNCGFHLNPIIAGNGECYKNSYVNYLTDNMQFYLRDFDYNPIYEYEITRGINETNVTANAKENLKIISRSDVSTVTNTALLTQWPGSTQISSCYGWRTLWDGKQDYTDGIDLAGSFEVKAAALGTVHFVCDDFTCNSLSGSCKNQCGDFGANIIIAHEGGFFTRYSHLSAINVVKDQQVRPGEIIGFSGNTGRSNGDHLDLKVYTSQEQITKIDGGKNPLCFFDDVTIESLNFVGKSCTEKFGSSISINNFPLSLAQDCAAVTSTPGNVEDIPKIVLDRSVQYSELIDREAEKNNVPSALIKSIFTQESGFQTKIISATGAAGIAQFTAETGNSYGLDTTPCCTAEQAAAGVCAKLTPPACPIDDERFIPEKAIPAAAKLLGELYKQYDQNIFLTAVAYNAGPGVANQMKQQPNCDIITAVNAVGCARIPTINAYNQKKFETEVKPYIENMKKYYPAWGGSIGQSSLFGSYYEINPSAKQRVKFDLTVFDKIYDIALELSKCTGDECAMNIVTNNNLKLSCTQLDAFDDFVMDYEQCKHYDWDSLNKTECGCDIEWPLINPNQKIVFLGDRIRLQEGDTIIKEHLSDGINNYYWNGNGLAWANYEYVYTTVRDTQNVGVSDPKDRSNVVTADRVIQQIQIPGNGTINLAGFTRTETGLILKNTANSCNALPKLRSYCYETGQSIIRLVDGTVGYQEIKVPFSVKLS